MKKILLLTMCMIALVSHAQTFRQWAPTPPMGWNSWDCYGPTVTENEVKANADYMAAHLKDYGWKYVVVDIRWFVSNTKRGGYNEKDPIYIVDEYGRYQPAENRFPSSAGGKGFKPLADYIHHLGLKFGIHIMRGVPKVAVERHTLIKGTDITADKIYTKDGQCQWLRDNYTVMNVPGAQEYYNSIIDLYASWGVDFIKCDDLSAPIYHADEIEMLRKAIDRCGRPIVLSTSPGETPVSAAAHLESHANMWRMVNDVWDSWQDITHLMKVAEQWYPHIKEGTWPDCDMIPLGHLSIRGERGEDRMTKLTRDEQYTLMTFWAIVRSPLFYGGDLPTMDPFTLSLLTNKSVLQMHNESSEVRQLFRDNEKLAVTSSNKSSGEHYLAIFNIADEQQTVSVALKSIGIKKGSVTNLWTGRKLGNRTTVSAKLAPHACLLVSVK